MHLQIHSASSSTRSPSHQAWPRHDFRTEVALDSIHGTKDHPHGVLLDTAGHSWRSTWPGGNGPSQNRDECALCKLKCGPKTKKNHEKPAWFWRFKIVVRSAKTEMKGWLSKLMHLPSTQINLSAVEGITCPQLWFETTACDQGIRVLPALTTKQSSDPAGRLFWSFPLSSQGSHAWCASGQGDVSDRWSCKAVVWQRRFFPPLSRKLPPKHQVSTAQAWKMSRH